jgi:hypothetical protein
MVAWLRVFAFSRSRQSRGRIEGRYFKSTLLEPFCPSLHELIAEWDREAKILSQEEEFHG